MINKITKNKKYNHLEIIKQLSGNDNIKVLTPQNLILSFQKGIFVPHQATFDFIDLIIEQLGGVSDISNIADIGTGSGVIGLTLAKLYPKKNIFLYDISPKALHLANVNAKLNGLENVTFHLNKKKEWIRKNSVAKIDLVVSNPPFTGDEELLSSNFYTEYPDYKYQPKQAMRTYDKYGISPYLSIIKEARNFKTKYFLFECNSDYIGKLLKKIIVVGYKFKIYRDGKKEKFMVLVK